MAATLESFNPADENYGRFSTGILPSHVLTRLLEQGRELQDMSWVLSAILLILIVGIGIELLIFAPIERRVLRSRGLLVKS